MSGGCPRFSNPSHKESRAHGTRKRDRCKKSSEPENNDNERGSREELPESERGPRSMLNTFRHYLQNH